MSVTMLYEPSSLRVYFWLPKGVSTPTRLYLDCNSSSGDSSPAVGSFAYVLPLPPISIFLFQYAENHHVDGRAVEAAPHPTL